MYKKYLKKYIIIKWEKKLKKKKSTKGIQFVYIVCKTLVVDLSLGVKYLFIMVSVVNLN